MLLQNTYQYQPLLQKSDVSAMGYTEIKFIQFTEKQS
jgi:hypothetical protein